METDDVQAVIHDMSAVLARRILAIDRKLSVFQVLSGDSSGRGPDELTGNAGQALRTIFESIRSDLVRDCVSLVKGTLSISSAFHLLDEELVREALRTPFEQGPFYLVTSSGQAQSLQEIDPRFVTLHRDFNTRYIQAKRLYSTLYASTAYAEMLRFETRLQRADVLAAPVTSESFGNFVVAASALVMQLELLVNRTRYALEGFRTKHRAVAESLLQSSLSALLEAV